MKTTRGRWPSRRSYSRSERDIRRSRNVSDRNKRKR